MFNQIQSENKMENLLKLDFVADLQSQHPTLILGGSLALWLQGIKLKRLEMGVGDLDFVNPFYINLNDDKSFIEDYYSSLPSGCDFQYQFYNTCKIDLRVDPFHPYRVVHYKGVDFKVCSWETILAAKLRYIESGGSSSIKHREDLRNMLKF
jgi:hypothetical protein